MNRFRLYALAALLSTAAMTAKADTIKVFNLTGTLPDGSIAGTVDINTTTGNFFSENVTYTGTNNAYSYIFNQSNLSTGTIFYSNPSSSFVYTQFTSTGGMTSYLELPVTTLINYNGGLVCSLGSQNDPCSPSSSSVGQNASNLSNGWSAENWTSGSLAYASQFTTAAQTPEPASLLLLGTGVVGAMGMARRRFLKG